MPTFISAKIPKVVTQRILELTLYEMMRSSHDFEDVKLALNDHTNWSIELFRSCFTIHLINGSNFFMLSTMSFLVMAESIHIHYGRLSPAELMKRAESMGYVTFAIIFVILDIGFVVVRVAGLVALSGTPGIATTLILVSILPSVIFPLLADAAQLVKRRKCATRGGDEVESGVMDNET